MKFNEPDGYNVEGFARRVVLYPSEVGSPLGSECYLGERSVSGILKRLFLIHCYAVRLCSPTIPAKNILEVPKHNLKKNDESFPQMPSY